MEVFSHASEEPNFYQYTTGGDPDILHIRLIASGGFGETHKAIHLHCIADLSR